MRNLEARFDRKTAGPWSDSKGTSPVLGSADNSTACSNLSFQARRRSVIRVLECETVRLRAAAESRLPSQLCLTKRDVARASCVIAYPFLPFPSSINQRAASSSSFSDFNSPMALLATATVLTSADRLLALHPRPQLRVTATSHPLPCSPCKLLLPWAP
jgi:hypothetical protein